MTKVSGWLFVDKPSGWTSFDVVNKVRRVIAEELDVRSKTVKVGHCGTLDPAATGLLILGVGDRTKQIGKLLKQDKVYEATVMLGQTSSTGDSEGGLERISEKQPTKSEINAALNRFTGVLEQRPPKYSALKIDGVAAYKRARAGEDFEIEKRQIEIFINHLDEYEYPELKFTTHVSSGTYVRTLAEDIGSYLQTGAYLSGLRRVKIGQYDLTQAISPDGVRFAEISQHLKTLDL